MNNTIRTKLIILVVIILVIIVTVLFAVVAIFVVNKNAVPKDESSQILSSYPVSNSVDKQIFKPSSRQLSQSLYESLKSKFQINTLSECSASLTSKTFSTINLAYNSCEWSVQISNKTGIQLSAMLMYVDLFVIFTNRTTKEIVQLQFNYPSVEEYFGPASTCFPNSTKQFTKISDYIYNYIYEYQDKGQILIGEKYISSEMVVQNEGEICKLNGPNFSIDAQYSNDELAFFQQMFIYRGEFKPNNITINITTKNPTLKTEELLRSMEIY